jgi:NitT/TauT family transport system substrate-binding protein
MKTNLIHRHFIVFLSVCLIGCGHSDDQPVSSQPSVELRVGVIPVAECAILNNAEVFRRHGITLKLTKAASGTQISDGVIGGGLDFGFSNLVTPIIAESRNIPLRIIGPISLEDDKRARHGLVVRKGGTINKVEDLKGKIIALNSFQNIDHLMVLRWLKENGVDPTEVRFQTMPFPTMVGALGNSSVDAVALVEPFITVALQNADKFQVLGNYYFSKTGKPTAVSGFVAREDWLKKDSVLTQNLIAALVEAAEDSTKNTKAFRADVVSMTTAEASIVEKMPLPWYQVSSYTDSLKDLAQSAADEKFIERPIDANNLIFVPKAR